ncbi:MAG: HAMP domain-containing protein [Calditrichaeota bacterium]|nr:MAG: HAMP domain-containing protein [Calditrichota bacterium]
MKKIRLSAQVFLTTLFISVMAIIATTWYASSLGRSFYIRQTTANLQQRAELIANILKPALVAADTTVLKEKWPLILTQDSTRVTVILPGGRVLADNFKNPAVMDNHISRPEIVNSLRNSPGTGIRFSHTVQRDMLYVAIPVRAGGELAGFVRVARDLSLIEKTISAMQWQIIRAGSLILILTIIAGFWVARRITNPLAMIIHGVEKFSSGIFSEKLPEPSTLEMARLTQTLNTMARQIDEKIAQIERQKYEQQSVLASMAEGVIAFDTEGHVLSINKAAARLFNVKRKQVDGWLLKQLVKNEELENLVVAVLETHRPQESEITIHVPTEQILNVRVSPLQDEQMRVIGALMVLNNITRLRNLERGRREFVANVSHELRTPLTSIKGFVEALHEGALDEPENARRFLEIIYRQTNRLISILEDLLTLSRLEREGGQDQVDFRMENLKGIMENAMQICEFSAEKKQIALHLECPDNLLVRVNGPLVEEALVNLVDNAIKYSPENSRVTIFAIKKNKKVLIGVQDQGQGIPEAHLNRIFERFYRVDKARSRKMGGTGLGLAIVKHIAQVHGGSVSVESQTGQGSLFKIYLPLNDHLTE